MVLDILPGNSFTRAYTEVSDQFEGVTIEERSTLDYANPLIASPYAHDWKTFFTKYEAPLDIKVEVKYTLPEFPVANLILHGKDFTTDLFPEDTKSLAEQELWGILLLSVQELLLTKTDEQTKKLLALTYGELLFRNGDFTGAYKQLYLLDQKYPNDQVGLYAKYLLALLRATYEDPFVADVILKDLSEQIHPKSLLTPYFFISKIELALATQQLGYMKELLDQDSVGFPPPLDKIRELRYTDYFFSTKQSIKAFVGYQLLEDTALISSHPFSLNGYCSTLYDQKQYETASQCYDSLLDNTKDDKSIGMISFRKAMADLKFKPLTSVLNDFSSIEDAFPGTDAGFKAALKKVDLMTITRDKWDDFSARYFRALAEKAVTKDTSEEAALKEAINFAIMEENEKSIELVMQYLRNYRSGKLTDTGEALLIDLLPGEIKRLVEQKEYVQAVVLARKNRRLFTNNWIDIKLLSDLALSFENLGIHEEAKRLYLYLIEILNQEQKEQYYYPLLRAIFKQGDFDLISDYATQYFFNYPQGKDTLAIKTLLLKALFAEKKYEEALNNLPNPIPDDLDFLKLLASIYYYTDRFPETANTLLPLWEENNLNQTLNIFMLADSLFHAERYQESKPIFIYLLQQDKTNQQIMYRLSKIEKRLNNQEGSLKYLNMLVETEEDSLWKTAAQKEIEFETFNEDFNKTRSGF